MKKDKGKDLIAKADKFLEDLMKEANTEDVKFPMRLALFREMKSYIAMKNNIEESGEFGKSFVTPTTTEVEETEEIFAINTDEGNIEIEPELMEEDE